MTTPNIEELRKLAESAKPKPIGNMASQQEKSAHMTRHMDARMALARAMEPEHVITMCDFMQSQAERVNELEQALQTGPEIIAGLFARAVNMEKERDELREKYTDTYWALDDAARENTSLRAELAAIAATEPVAYRWVWKSKPHDIEGWCYTHTPPNHPELQEIEPLFTRPMPAQDVNAELVELLEFMWRDVSMNEYAFEKLEAALSKYKGAK